MLIPVVLSGGSGTRLWPLSRKEHPKQFIKLGNQNSLFQQTLLRLPKNASKPIIICNDNHRFIVAEQLREVESSYSSILLEPIAKNTAPAIALAALEIISYDSNGIMLVMPSDHYIKKLSKLHQSFDEAHQCAVEGNIVTFGVLPSKPNTGYGYIKTTSGKNKCLNVQSFKEKPSLKVAEKYIKSGNYFWNSGMFLMKAKVFLDELRKYEPNIYKVCQTAYHQKIQDIDFTRFSIEVFDKCPEKSIDYAVLEKSKLVKMVALDSDWSDLGTWDSIWSNTPKDKFGNTLYADNICLNTKNSLVYSKEKLVAITDVENLIIVDTPDALFVANKEKIDNIKLIIESLKKENREELTNNKLVYRPWGYFKSVEVSRNFQIKLIVIKPNAKISLQKHIHRSEHWVVISGIATVTQGDKKQVLEPNQSTFIPAGLIHRLENNTNNDLRIIEIQTGDYFGEDDIIRLEDVYSRD